MELEIKKREVYLRAVVEFRCGCSVGLKVSIDGALAANLQPSLPLPCADHSAIELADTIDDLAKQLDGFKKRLEKSSKKKKARKRRG